MDEFKKTNIVNFPKQGPAEKITPLRTCHTLPQSARSFFLNIKEMENGHFSGEIFNLFYEDAIPFCGLDEAILRMNQMMDELSSPQASTALRSFCDRKKEAESEVALYQRREQILERYYEKEFMQSRLSRKPQIQIEVLYRQNATWQGRISLMRPFEPRCKCFRSVLELIHLIHSVYQQ
ncbi:hypothetical protein MM50RIKEN_13750 [Vescimonas coprocola]|jgi:hypothetical protein|uniref:Uncharacterized protein n=1 Tax=Vescimonas coprocola TaxID=2714355 RepID=A0A810Q5S6_9FIRM|nr:hypothetical protein [Vescimonas coprocola]BCK81612.1 hypothetical protein MM50RIKEN_13750 [Vescimonas coprocola]